MDYQVVHVRINDAATGKPTPVRVRFVDPAGRYRAPLGRLEHFATGFGQHVGGQVEVEGVKFAYIDGSCEILLPKGPIRIEVHKGPEYAPVSHVFHRQPGQITLRLAIERRFNLGDEGWCAGDICAHFLSTQAAGLEGAAEGLQVVNVLAAGWEDEAGRPFISSLLDFSGQQEPPAMHGCLVAVNTRNRGGSQGDYLLLHSHRPVSPLRLGQIGFEHYTPLDLCGQCHRKGGLVASTRFPSDPTLHQAGGQCSVDALAWTLQVDFVREVLPEWYAHLNRGQARNLAIVGGSGKASNGELVGAIRTYAQIPAAAGGETAAYLTYAKWIEAIRNGRSFATRGPLPELVLDKSGSGMVQARARNLAHAGRLDLACNGDVVGEARPGADGMASLELTQQLPSSSWLVARCWGEKPDDLLAHTSPIWLTHSCQ